MEVQAKQEKKRGAVGELHLASSIPSNKCLGLLKFKDVFTFASDKIMYK